MATIGLVTDAMRKIESRRIRSLVSMSMTPAAPDATSPRALTSHTTPGAFPLATIPAMTSCTAANPGDPGEGLA
jgi:hypothetical protein